MGGVGRPPAWYKRTQGATIALDESKTLGKSREREEANIGAGLWKGLGMWAWILFRISGLILVAYLFVHIVVISQGEVGGPDTLDKLFEMFENPFLAFLDFMLVAAVLYHGLNGVRVILMDFGVGIRNHKAVFWVVMAIAAGLLAWFAVVAAPHIF